MKFANAEKNFKNGSLPGSYAPLAMSYTPLQTSAVPSYEASEALSRGTLFPGLDLPFMNMVNKNKDDGTPLSELMAIDFVAKELELYLDTHAGDEEAFSMYQTFLALSKEAHKRYVQNCGPICQTDLLGKKDYCWLNDPWPWEYQGRKER